MRYVRVILTFLLFGIPVVGSCTPMVEDGPGGTATVEITAEITPLAVETATATSEGEAPTDIRTQENLTLWHSLSGVEADVFEALVSEFNDAMRDEIEVTAYSHADEDVLIADVTAAIGTENVPDIILSPSYFIRKLTTDGWVLPIEISTSENDQAGAISELFPAFSKVDIINGVRFGVPYLQFGNFLFYQSSWANEIGLPDAPGTIEAFEQATCEAFNVNRFDEDLENNGTGGYFYPSGSMPLAAWMRAFGGGAQFNSRGALILDSEENIRALTFLFDLWRADCAWWTDREQYPYRYFLEEKAIAYSGRSDEIISQYLLMEEAERSFDWQIMPYPSLDGKPIILFNSYSFALMEKASPQVESATKFIAWMLEPERHLEMVYVNAAFPIRSSEIQAVDRTWELLPYWQESIRYIPFLEPVPLDENWYLAEKVLDDLSWQMIQFAVTAADIPGYLQQAEMIVNTTTFESEQ